MFKDESNENLEKDVIQIFVKDVICIIIRYDSITTQRDIIFVLSIETMHYLEGHFTILSIWDDIIIQKAPRRSLCSSIEALYSFGTKDGIKM